MRRDIWISLFVLLLPFVMQAQDVRVSATVDSTRFLIGEWIHLDVSVDAPGTVTLRLPAEDDDIIEGEFVSAEDPEVEEKDGRRLYRQNVIATVFDTGSVSLRVRVRYTRQGDTTTYEALSQPIALAVTTVELDTSEAFKDIKDVLDVPLTIWDYLLYAAALLLLLLAAWLLYRWYRRRQERPVEEAPVIVPDIPAHVLALHALEALQERKLWQQGQHKEYQSELTDILRRYIEQRWNVPAMEQPTSEIMPGVAMLGLAPSMLEMLERSLRVADMTKFARFVPTSAQHEDGMRFARTFVESTRSSGEESLSASSPSAVATETESRGGTDHV